MPLAIPLAIAGTAAAGVAMGASASSKAGRAAGEGRSLEQEAENTLETKLRLAPDVFRAESSPDYGQPAYARLEMKTLAEALRGTEFNGEEIPGLYELYRESAGELGEANVVANRMLRDGDIRDLRELGPAAVAAIKDANPEAYRLLARLTADAEREMDLGSSVDPEEARMAEQGIRAAYSDRGRWRSNAAVTAEVLERYGLGQQRLRDRRAFAGQVLGYQAGMSVDPALAVLGRQSTNQASSAGAFAQGGNLSGGPDYFNPFDPYAADLYNTNYNAQVAARLNAANARAGLGAGLLSMAGSLGGAAIGRMGG